MAHPKTIKDLLALAEEDDDGLDCHLGLRSPKPISIICPVWPNGCSHPELCEDSCRDVDLKYSGS